MVRGAGDVERVATCVFPSDRIVAGLEPGTLLFSEHPLDFADEPGFLPLARESFEALSERACGFYHAHAPLDMHPEVSPSRLCARGGRPRSPRGVLPDRRRDSGRRRDRRQQRALARGARRGVPRVPRARDQGARDHAAAAARPGRVAVVAGGGADVDILQASIERGCQTYVTGNAATNCRLDLVQEKVRGVQAAGRRGRGRAHRRDALRHGEAAAAGDGQLVSAAGAAGRVRA